MLLLRLYLNYERQKILVYSYFVYFISKNLFKLLNFYLKYFLNNNINIFQDIWINPFKFDIWAILYNSHLTNDNRNNEKTDDKKFIFK